MPKPTNLLLSSEPDFESASIRTRYLCPTQACRITDEPTYSPGIDGIERDTMLLILSAAEASGLPVRVEVQPSPKGDYWVQVTPAVELARLIKKGQRTKFFAEIVGEDRLQQVEVLLGPYMDMA